MGIWLVRVGLCDMLEGSDMNRIDGTYNNGASRSVCTTVGLVLRRNLCLIILGLVNVFACDVDQVTLRFQWSWDPSALRVLEPVISINF
jgi:hypothetical protein